MGLQQKSRKRKEKKKKKKKKREKDQEWQMKKDVKKREKQVHVLLHLSHLLQENPSSISWPSSFFIWAWRLESGRRLLRREWWDPCRGRSQILLRLGGGGIGTQGESRRKSGRCTYFSFHRHRLQNGPLGRRGEAHPRRSRASFPSSNIFWGFASELQVEGVCLIFWWPFLQRRSVGLEQRRYGGCGRKRDKSVKL